MKTPDAHRDARGAQGTGQVHGVGELIRLNSDQGHHAAFAAELPRDAFGTDAGIGFVEGADHDFDVIA